MGLLSIDDFDSVRSSIFSFGIGSGTFSVSIVGNNDFGCLLGCWVTITSWKFFSINDDGKSIDRIKNECRIQIGNYNED